MRTLVLLENTGFKLKPGQLEVFPNPRPFTEGPLSLYNGHRLPLQAGSYLLNDQWQFVYTDQAAFVEQWRWAEQRNDLNGKTIERVLKQSKRQRYKGVTGGSQKFLNDLDTEIEPGWTGSSQTNKLLGWIAMREYIFGHVLRGGEPITGPALADKIREVAVELPGYTEHCQHQHEIDKKAAEWAKSIEADPNYYPYDPSKRRKTSPQLESQPTNNIVSFNQQLALDAEARIQAAIATLQADGTFPSGATARADAIVALARCSNQTVHKYKALWHPDYIERSVGTVAGTVTAPSGNPDALLPETLESLPEGSLHPFHPNKFRANAAALSGQAARQQEAGGPGGISTGEALQAVPAASEPEKATTNPEITTTKPLSPLPEPENTPTGQANLAPSGESKPKALPQPQSFAKAAFSAVTGALTGAAAAIAQRVAEKQQRQATAYLEKMTRWLELGDPILVKEAEAWFAARAERARSQLGIEETDPGG